MRLINEAYVLLAKVVSIAKSTPLAINSSILFNIIFAASIATPSTLKGDRPFAILSALIKYYFIVVKQFLS